MKAMWFLILFILYVTRKRTSGSIFPPTDDSSATPMITHEEVHEVKWPIHDEVVLPAKSKDEKKNVCSEVHENTVAENEKHEETLNHKEKLIQLSEESKSQEKHWQQNQEHHQQNQTEILLKNITSEYQRPIPQPPLPLLLATVYDKNISNTPVTVITNTSTDINNLSI